MNPIITHKFTADPTVLIHNGEVFLYTGHDEAPVNTYNYVMNEWLCFSSRNMKQWREHPIPLKAKDFSWAKGDAYASRVVKRDGRFYWYGAVTHGTLPGKAIGVAVADTPMGPFHDAIGSALITSEMNILPGSDNFDPSVLVDDDGQAYIFWGKDVCCYAMLEDNMTALASEIKSIDLPGFQEGIHIHKRRGWYYLSYGYGAPEKVVYAMSRNIHGPWDIKGILNEIAGNCETNRPAILDLGEKSYFFYHNGALPHGGSHRRSVCVDRLYYKPDGTLRGIFMTSEGIEED